MTPVREAIKGGNALAQELRTGSSKVVELRTGGAAERPFIFGSPRVEIRQ